MTCYPGLPAVLSGVLLGFALSAGAETLPLQQAEQLALGRDTGAASLVKQASAMRDAGVADSQLPDPMVFLGWLNLPIEGFDLREEPMNQIRIGVKQTFPAGDSLAIKARSADAGADAMLAAAGSRRLDVLRQTREAWLEVQYQQAALAVVIDNEPLFAQLRDVTRSLYSTGKKSLNDVVRAELEVQRLKDREIAIQEMIEKQRAVLARWTGPLATTADIPRTLPAWSLAGTDKAAMAKALQANPAILAMDRKIGQLRAQVDLARQQYKPGFSVEAAYAFRNAQRPNGAEVSDLVSIGASMSLPLFTKNRQDKRVAAMNSQLNAAMDDRTDMLAAMAAKLDVTLVRFDRLNDRISLHGSTIVPQSQEQAQAALMAYQADRADFAEVMRAYIGVLESKLKLRRLQTDRLEAIATAWNLLPPANDMENAHEQ